MNFHLALGKVCDCIVKVGDCLLPGGVFISEVLVGIVAVF